MVDHVKLFCTGMLLVFLSIGCTGTGSNNGGTSQVSKKRMLSIAQTYQQRGHQKRAIQAYQQVLNQHPDSKQASIARQRILALNGSANNKQSAGVEQSLLAASDKPRQDFPATKQSKIQVKTVSLETRAESAAPALSLPIPKYLAKPAKAVSMKKTVSKKTRPAQNNSVSALSKYEDATWPEWSKPKTASGSSQTTDPEMPAKQPEFFPVLDRFRENLPREELLSPPAALMDRNDDQKMAWVATDRKAESNDDNQELAVQRLASLVYLIGKEKTVTDEVLASLEVLLDHENEQVRINSSEALFQHGRGSEKAIKTIAKAFSSNDESTRIIAVHAMASAYDQSPKETVRIMMAQLETDSPPVQRHIALLLGNFQGHSSSLRPVLQHLANDHPDAGIREAASLSLVCLKE